MSKRHLPKRSFVTALLVALILLMGSVPPTRMYAQKPDSAAAGKMQVSLAWRVPGADVVQMGLTPSAQRAFTVTSAGKVSVYDLAGKPAYTVRVPGANRVVLSPDAKYAVAYSHLDPLNFTLTFLDSQGNIAWKTSAAGAVWCADGCTTGRGARFVVGTGQRCVYIFDIAKSSRRYRWWRTGGTVTSINIHPNGDHIRFGTWQESSIACRDVAGGTVWQKEMDSTSLHYLHSLSAPDRMLLRCVPNRRGADGEFHITDGSGSTIWQGEISAEARTKLVCSPSGNYVCLGQLKVIEHKGKSVSEKHAVLYDENGERLWEQGSMFFQVQPLYVSNGGEALLVNSKGALFVVRRDGSLEAGEKLPGSVIRSVQSVDGSALLVQCSDGSVCRLNID